MVPDGARPPTPDLSATAAPPSGPTFRDRAASAIAQWRQRRRGGLDGSGPEGQASTPSLTQELVHDFLRLGPAVALCLIGIALIYGVCVPVEGSPERLYWRRQVAFLVLGLLGYAVIAKAYFRIASQRVAMWVLYGTFCVGLLVLVLFIGRSTGNGLRWLPLAPGIAIQPAEFAKVVLIWVVAELVNPPVTVDRVGRLRRYLLALLAVVIPAALVCLERSMGNTALLCASVGVVLCLRWLSWPALAIALAAGVVFLAPFALEIARIRNPTPGVNMARYEALEGRSDPERLPMGLTPREVSTAIAPKGATGLLSHCPDRIACYLSQAGGWNARQALRCIRIGGIDGAGYRAGNITILGYLPRTVQHTDFIYCVLSESYGFWGALVVLGLITWLLVAILWFGARSASPAAWSFSVGFATLIFLQTAIHVGMALRLLPIIGIPLPFVSYGGTFLLTSFAALGVVARYDSPLAVPMPAPAPAPAPARLPEDRRLRQPELTPA